MKNVVTFNEENLEVLSSNNKMDEMFYSCIIEEKDAHRYGVGNGLLAENKDFGGA